MRIIEAKLELNGCLITVKYFDGVAHMNIAHLARAVGSTTEAIIDAYELHNYIVQNHYVDMEFLKRRIFEMGGLEILDTKEGAVPAD